MAKKMKQYFSFLWQLALTPIYYGFLLGTSLIVLVALGPREFREFWRKNK